MDSSLDNTHNFRNFGSHSFSEKNMTYLYGNIFQNAVDFLIDWTGGAEQKAQDAERDLSRISQETSNRMQWQQLQIRENEKSMMIGGAVILFSIVGIWFFSRKK